MAAAIQSGIGNVVAGSPFAVAQSIGAGGALLFMGFVIGAAVGVLVIGGVSYGVYRVVQTRSIWVKMEGYVALCEKRAGRRRGFRRLDEMELHGSNILPFPLPHQHILTLQLEARRHSSLGTYC